MEKPTYKEVAEALRNLMNYTGGWDAPDSHPCGAAARMMHRVDGRDCQSWDMPFLDHVERFARLYPHLRIGIRFQDETGARYDTPNMGYLCDGAWINTSHACAIGDMTPVDAILMQALNMPGMTFEEAARANDLNDAFFMVQEACQITTGDVAGLFCSGMDAEAFWSGADEDQRIAYLLAYLTFESVHTDQDLLRQYRRTDAQAHWRVVNVIVADCEGWSVPAYWDGRTWNGWVVPRFTLQSMRELARHAGPLVENSDGTFTRTDEGADVETISPVPTDIDGTTIALYTPDGWCFQLDE
ncbi:hypothetical protein K2O51_30955 (plasmid) [Cupriavidus pinatubonensis]|uniref:hypothetical protein n=1 Tax=Cupriavidus pinatubonensis TaxID=248026 RepID=UPI001C72BF5E|nr:hypothetical protein [Cupriavidus pinatubonensis]QYY33669.1 hypothetical protein K2O51_30955 [Cupriavidus pinatubonensis]